MILFPIFLRCVACFRHLGYHEVMAVRPNEIHPTTLRILRAMRAGVRLSRNRHFSLFQDPKARQGLRLFHYLRSVAADVRAYREQLSVDVVEADGTLGDVALRIDFPLLNGHRTAYLRRVELELLAEDAPEVAALLVEHLPVSA